MSSRRLLGLALLPLLLAGCGDEQPLGIGHELLPPDALRTFEVTLEPEQFLLRDTAFAFYSEVGATEYMLIARDYAGVLNAVELARWEIPRAIAVIDSAGRNRVDSAYTVLRGEVLVNVDTVATPLSSATLAALHAFAEEWTPTEADWEFRKEGVRWATPGGTVGALLDTTRVTRDSVFLTVDSATVRQWADTTNQRRGARVSIMGAPARLRAVQHPRLQIIARSTHHPDTTFTVTVAPFVARNDYRPRPATTSSEIRLSGSPAWRSFLQFRPGLGDVVVSCGQGCTIRLRDAAITRAELVLQPVAAPAGFDPELGIQPFAYEALVDPVFPLPRTPLGTQVGAVPAALPPSRFAGGGAPGLLLVTEFIRQLVLDDADAGDNPFAGTGWLAVQHQGTPTFGIGTFAAGPRLRLVLSTAREIQLP